MAVILPRIFADALVAGENAVAGSNTQTAPTHFVSTTRDNVIGNVLDNVPITKKVDHVEFTPEGPILLSEADAAYGQDWQAGDYATTAEGTIYKVLNVEPRPFTSQVHLLLRGTMQF